MQTVQQCERNVWKYEIFSEFVFYLVCKKNGFKTFPVVNWTYRNIRANSTTFKSYNSYTTIDIVKLEICAY